MANTTEVSQGLPTTAELRHDVLNRDRPTPDGEAERDNAELSKPPAFVGSVDELEAWLDADEHRADDDGMAQFCADDEYSAQIARHCFDLGGEA